jgi:hypothetical protein
MSELRPSGMRSNDHNGSLWGAAATMGTPGVIERKYVSYAVAQQMFGLSRTTLWRLLRSGDIEGVRVGCTLRLSVASIEAFLTTKKV